MPGRSSTFASITVVLTCTVTPASASCAMAVMVLSKCPAIPRTPSWVCARQPSRLTETARTPLRAIRSIMAASSSGVTDGDRHTGMPSDTA